ALATYLELCQKHPDYVGTYYHLGKLYERKESFSEAFETYREGMRIAKAAEDRHALNELAGAKLNLGDDEDFE
ncbi:MAG: tetratricopeptide repeat protein, partial [Bacteroidota bacterium]